MTLTRMTVALSLAAGLAACNSSPKAADDASYVTVNKVCAVMHEDGHPVDPNDPVMVEYKGKKVGFCCSDCIDSWNAMSDADKDKALAAATAK